MDAIQPTAASYYQAAFMSLPPLPLSPSCLILCRSILPFSASTSAATAAVVFGRSRKDDGLMRNLEVSRRSPIHSHPQGGVQASWSTSGYKAHRAQLHTL